METTTSLLVLSLVMLVSASAVLHLLRHHATRLRLELAVAKDDFAKSEEEISELSSLLALEHETNYRMACAIYGKRSVDRSMRKAHDKAVN
jgi:hypothetical protein